MSRLVKRVNYEWDLEQFDPESEDIIDHHHFDECPGLPTEKGLRLVLVRDVYEGLSDEFNCSADLIDRSWAYVERGKLPEFTDNGERVPQKFHKELSKTI